MAAKKTVAAKTAPVVTARKLVAKAAPVAAKAAPKAPTSAPDVEPETHVKRGLGRPPGSKNGTSTVAVASPVASAHTIAAPRQAADVTALIANMKAEHAAELAAMRTKAKKAGLSSATTAEIVTDDMAKLVARSDKKDWRLNYHGVEGEMPLFHFDPKQDKFVAVGGKLSHVLFAIPTDDMPRGAISRNAGLIAVCTAPDAAGETWELALSDSLYYMDRKEIESFVSLS